MGHLFLLFAVVLAVGAWPVYSALRTRRRWEAAGYAALAAILAGVLVLVSVGAPRWTTNVLVGSSFLVWAPLTWVNLKRRYRAMRDAAHKAVGMRP